jgi:hypothetical protein
MHTQQQGFQFTSAWRMGLLGLIMSQVLLVWGCAEHHEMGHHVHPAQGDAKEVRSDPARTGLISMGLDPAAQEAHKTVMRAHFEAVHKIVAALAEEDFVKAGRSQSTSWALPSIVKRCDSKNPSIFPRTITIWRWPIMRPLKIWPNRCPQKI